MKSLIVYLQGIYAEVFEQISERFPALLGDCTRDASRLRSLIESRGLSFAMIDLPDLGKHFDKCLSEGRLTLSSIAGSRPYKRGSTIPRLFKGLWILVFDEKGVLRDDPDIQAIRYLRQLLYVAKKLEVACDDSKTWEHVNEFFRIDLEARSPSLNWDEDSLGHSDYRHLHLRDAYVTRSASANDGLFDDRKQRSLSFYDAGPMDAAQQVADMVVGSFGGFYPSEWRAKHGPGAVADLRYTTSKYTFPNWPAKLDRVFPLEEYGFSNFSSWAAWSGSSEAQRTFKSHEPPSKLIAVPKTLKGPRLIASEPTSYQWCQQLIRDFLASRIAFGQLQNVIHLRDQTWNQRMALRASHTQTHVTIDLSSASDRLSCWTVERIFRSNKSLLEALHSSRTRWVVNTIDRKSPQYHVLRKFACMGSAVTFPVQSIVYSILAIAAVLHSTNSEITYGNIRRVTSEVQVFGDDIIIPRYAWETLQGLLADLGFEVNHKKTHVTGRFRESCGVDAYDGHDVTPVYLKAIPDVSLPESIISVVETHNNFFSKGYWRVCNRIKSTVEHARKLRVRSVLMDSGSFGWSSFDPDLANAGFKTRFNKDLHRMEIMCSKVQTKLRRSPVENDSTLLQYFTEVLGPPLQQGERLGVALRPAVNLIRGWEPIPS